MEGLGSKCTVLTTVETVEACSIIDYQNIAVTCKEPINWNLICFWTCN